MAITATHIASWGVADAHTQATVLEIGSADSVVTAWNTTHEPIMAPEHNEKGSVIGQCVYDSHTTVRASFNIKASVGQEFKAYASSLDKYIVQVTVDSVAYYATSIEIAETNNDYMKANVALERYANTITPWNGATGSSNQ